MNSPGIHSINGRAKAGNGKQFYGMTASHLAKLKTIRADSASGLRSHSDNLCQFTAMYVKHARDLAKTGFKDEARNWFRFFTNSQILTVLQDLPQTGDLAKLREDLNFLGLECHPLDVPSFTNDLSAICSCLTEILSHVQQTPLRKETVRRFGDGRTFNSRHGQSQPKSKNFERPAPVTYSPT